MEIRRLSYFVRVADDGSLTRAAGVLRVAQPALSRQIRLLEEELGEALFNRTPQGMRLTEAGEYLRASVAGPLRAIDLALQNVRSFSSPMEGDVVIGMPSGIGDALAAPLVTRVAADFPKIRMRMVEGATAALIDWLNRGIVDYALLEEAAKDERLSDLELFSEPLALVGPPDCDLAADIVVPLERAAQLPLILPSHHLGVRRLLNDAAAKARIKLNIRAEADSWRLIKDLVAGGMGYAVLPASFLIDEDRKLRIAQLGEPTITFTAVLASRHNSAVRRDGIDRMMVESILKTVEQLKAGPARV